jgi:hypothetical protein
MARRPAAVWSKLHTFDEYGVRLLWLTYDPPIDLCRKMFFLGKKRFS